MSTTKAAEQTAFERWELPNVGPRVAAGQRVPAGTLTAAQVEAVQNQAYEEAARDGHKDGFARGFQEGKQAARAEMDVQVDRFRTLVEYLAEPLALVDDRVEQRLALMAMTVARQIVKGELSTDPTRIEAGVRAAVEVLGSVDEAVRITLHPDDHRLLQGAGVDMATTGGWQVIEDPSMTPGGCRLDCGSSTVDASVERRMADAIEAVLGVSR